MNFKFTGVIDCNTELELENISRDECIGIERFIKALRNSHCSYVSATTNTNANHGYVNTIDALNIGAKLYFIDYPERLHIYNSCMGAAFKWYEKPQKPIEKKII